MLRKERENTAGECLRRHNDMWKIENDQRTEMEQYCWNFILNRWFDEAMYSISLDGCVSSGLFDNEERELEWKQYLSSNDEHEEQCWKIINSERQQRLEGNDKD